MLDRALTPEEKEKHRQWQMREILRRRNGTPSVEPGSESTTAVADPEAPKPLGNCPDCGKPYGKIRRCWACKPCTPKDKGKGKVKVEWPKPRREPEREEPAGEEPTVLIPLAAPVPAVAVQPLAGTSPVGALRQIVGVLAELSDQDARWAVDAAYRLSRSQA
jgi:hypothetical protein